MGAQSYASVYNARLMAAHWTNVCNKLCRSPIRDGSRGVQGVRTPAPLIRCPFLKRTYFQNGRIFVGFRASGGAKFPKMGDSMPRTPMNHRAKFDAASFIPGGEIRTVQSDKFTNKQTNSNRHIHTLPISMCGNDNQRSKLNKK